MICDINPYTISRIHMKRFHRWGRHPAWLKVMKKRHPVKASFGLYERGLFDGYYSPCVCIYGSDGDLLKQIKCRSNDHAKQLTKELNNQLANFVKSTKAVDISIESV